jgi:hypothetical protein
MSKLGYLLSLPITGGPRLVRSLSSVVEGEIEAQLLDEDALRGELLDIREQLQDGLIDDREYELRESRVLERLEMARFLKTAQST